MLPCYLLPAFILHIYHGALGHEATERFSPINVFEYLAAAAKEQVIMLGDNGKKAMKELKNECFCLKNENLARHITIQKTTR